MEPTRVGWSWPKRGCAVSRGFGKRVGSRGALECGVLGGIGMSSGLQNAPKQVSHTSANQPQNPPSAYKEERFVLILFPLCGLGGWRAIPTDR
jgi:hypothetical protein